MPSYKVLSKGFANGRIYDPNGKRKILHREKPFPSKDKKEQLPSWLEAIKAAPVDNGMTVKDIKEKLKALDVEFNGNSNKDVLIEILETAETAAKVEQDKKDIIGASFLAKTDSTVETL